MQYTKKTIVSGNHIREIKVIGSSVLYGYESKKTNYAKAEEGSKTDYSLRRAQDNLVQTINCNVNAYSKLITLTFKKTVLNRKDAMTYFKYFQTYFKRNFKEPLKYCGITERQKKRGIKEHNAGSWHFHLVVFNSKKLDFKQLKKCWLYGSVDIKKIDSTENLGRYLGKYLSKEYTDIKLNEKTVFKSRGLKKPLIKYDVPLVEDAKLKYNTSYDFVDDDTGSVITFELSEYIIPNKK